LVKLDCNSAHERNPNLPNLASNSEQHSCLPMIKNGVNILYALRFIE